MLDAPTDRTRVTSAVPLRAKQHDAGIGHERRSAAEPSPLWSNASSVINILPLKAKVKHRVPCSPTRDCPFELEITFCVRGVVSPVLSNILLTPFDREMRLRGYQLTRFADDWVVTCRSAAEARAAMDAARRILNSWAWSYIRRRRGLFMSDTASSSSATKSSAGGGSFICPATRKPYVQFGRRTEASASRTPPPTRQSIQPRPRAGHNIQLRDP